MKNRNMLKERAERYKKYIIDKHSLNLICIINYIILT